MNRSQIKPGTEYAVQDSSYTRQLGEEYGLVRLRFKGFETRMIRKPGRYAQSRVENALVFETCDGKGRELVFDGARRVLGTWAQHEERKAANLVAAAAQADRLGMAVRLASVQMGLLATKLRHAGLVVWCGQSEPHPGQIGDRTQEEWDAAFAHYMAAWQAYTTADVHLFVNQNGVLQLGDGFNAATLAKVVDAVAATS